MIETLYVRISTQNTACSQRGRERETEGEKEEEEEEREREREGLSQCALIYSCARRDKK